MAKKYLFSPIGGNDPIANNRDGSFLHICRNYLPDKVYLFLSKEMWELHSLDDRYLYCLRQLGDLKHHEFEYEIIAEKELSEVQDYNYFYREFHDIIRDIRAEMKPEDLLYVNIASGTPAMKSALQILAAVTEYRFIPVQVSTPQRKMNPKAEDHIHYEPDIQWACDNDNDNSQYENRCSEVRCENLMTLLKLDQIRKFISACDYRAARIIADELQDVLSDEAKRLIRAAEARLQLDRSGTDKNLGEMLPEVIPVQPGNQRSVVEYLLALEIKIRKGEYADFLRGITPVVAELFEMILEEQCGIVIDKCCRTERGQRRWDPELSEKYPEIWSILDEEYDHNFSAKEVYSDHLWRLIRRLSKNAELLNLTNDLREIESAVRNVAAHEITSVTEQWIRDRTRKKGGVKGSDGFTPNQIFQIMKKLCRYAGLPLGDRVWKSYDHMNSLIFSKLEQTRTVTS